MLKLPVVAPTLTALLVVLGVAAWQGMVGVWVKWSSWSPMAMVWARCALSSLLLLGYEHRTSTRSLRREARIHLHPSARMTWGGLLLAGHWVTLFIGYRIAPIGPVVVALFTFPIMASIAEPLTLRRRPQRRQLGAAALMVAGVTAMQLLTPSPGAAGQARLLGVLLGLCSAACFAARNILCRRLLAQQSAISVMGWQSLIVALLLTPALAQLEPDWLDLEQLALLLVLGIGFTALPHTLNVWALTRLSVATSGIVGSLQTVSTIVLATLLLDEPLQPGVLLGAAAVVAAVAWESHAQLVEPKQQ